MRHCPGSSISFEIEGLEVRSEQGLESLKVGPERLRLDPLAVRLKATNSND
jgi:hypothetical protein